MCSFVVCFYLLFLNYVSGDAIFLSNYRRYIEVLVNFLGEKITHIELFIVALCEIVKLYMVLGKFVKYYTLL